MEYSQVAPGTSHSLPKTTMEQHKYSHPNLGETRNIKVEKSLEPLGIQIESGSRGGIFVSSVSEHSLASKNGISVGDQLLEVRHKPSPAIIGCIRMEYKLLYNLTLLVLVKVGIYE